MKRTKMFVVGFISENKLINNTFNILNISQLRLSMGWDLTVIFSDKESISK